jgi:hypothetical protein
VFSFHGMDWRSLAGALHATAARIADSLPPIGSRSNNVARDRVS